MPETPIIIWPLDPGDLARPLDGQAGNIFRPYVTPGDPASGINLPAMADVITLMQSQQLLAFLVASPGGNPATGARGFPAGTTAERPDTSGPLAGVPMIRFNTETGLYEAWNPVDAEWQGLGGAAPDPDPDPQPSAVYLETFAMDVGAPASSFYGRQLGIIGIFDGALGTLKRSSYLDLGGKTTFIRGLVRHQDGRLIIGQSRLGVDPDGSEVTVSVMPPDISAVQSRFGVGDTTTPLTAAQDGQPGLAVAGNTVFVAHTTSAPVAEGDTTFEANFGGGSHLRVAVQRLDLAGEPESTLTLDRTLYIRPAEPTTGHVLGETHMIKDMPNGNVLVAGEVTGGAVLPLPAGAEDDSPPALNGRKGWWMEFDSFLSQAIAGSYFGNSADANDAYFDGVDVSPDGSRFCMPFVIKAGDVPTTDGTTFNQPAAGRTGGGIVVYDAATKARVYSSIIAQPTAGYSAECRRARFDDQGAIYVAGAEALGDRMQPCVWKLTPGQEEFFGRAPFSASQIRSPAASTLSLGTQFIVEFEALDITKTANINLIEYVADDGRTIKAVWQVNDVIRIEPGDAGPYYLNVAGLWTPQSTLTLFFDGDTGSGTVMYVLIDGELINTYNGGASPTLLNGSNQLFFLEPVNVAFTAHEIRFWWGGGQAAPQPGGWSPAGAPNKTLTPATVNSDPWKIGLVDFMLSGSNGYDLAWKTPIPVDTGGEGQVRGVEPLVPSGLGVVVSGGMTNFAGTWTEDNRGAPGGDIGTAPPYDAFVARLDPDDGSIMWISSLTSDGVYQRFYDLVVDNQTGDVTAVGRAGENTPVGVV